MGHSIDELNDSAKGNVNVAWDVLRRLWSILGLDSNGSWNWVDVRDSQFLIALVIVPFRELCPSYV